MSRSVSYPSDAIVAFDFYESDDEFAFDDLVDEFVFAVDRAYPSVRPVDEWIGREDHAYRANDHAYFGVSEYCGLVSLWAAERYDSERPELARQWLSQIEPGFIGRFGRLRKIGRFSNGEAIFERVAASADQGIMK